jgi:RNA polymerase sigma factor (sigma-70 family)
MDDSALITGFVEGRVECHRQIDHWIAEVLRQFHLGHDVDDVAQEVRRKLLDSFRAQRFDGRAALRTYVWKAAQRAAIDRARAHKRRPAPIALEDRPELVAVPAEDPIERQERRALFDRLMASLGEGCQRLWGLIVFEELSYAEIAHRLGITQAAVKVRALRCRAEASRIHGELVTAQRAQRPSMVTAG